MRNCAGVKSDGSRLHSCGCSFRVYHFHNLPVPTVFTGLRICQNDVLQVGAREVSGMSLPKAGRRARS